MRQTLIALLFAALIGINPTHADLFRWDDAFRYIDFDKSTSSPFTLYSQSDFSAPPNVWASFHPELGPYGGHVWKPGKLEYDLDVTDAGFDFVDVKLGFAEVYLLTCTSNARVMRVSVNDKTLLPVDIFALVGCRRPHDLVFERVVASAPIKIRIEGIVENPMISNLIVRQSTGESASPVSLFSGASAETSTSRSYGAFNKVVYITAMSDSRFSRIPGTSVLKDRDARVEGTVRPEALLGHRHGRNFTYHIKGRGTYEIQLAFAETNPLYCEGTTNRVFSVFFNGMGVMANLNVFKRVGCRRAFIHTHRGFAIRGDLFITFTGTKGDAMVSHIVVRKVKTSCVPESTADAATSDHLAHAIPGHYPAIRSATSPRAYVDVDSNGYEKVFINGDGSHTHFFDTVNNIAGRVTTYEWTSPDTTEFISAKKAFSMKFMLGTTRLSLRVEDNICSSHISETSVTVTGSVTPGTYCYFYPGQSTLPEGVGPDQEVKPSFAKAYSNTIWNFTDLPFASSAFAARCEFFVSTESDAASIRGFVSTSGSGRVTLLRGADVVVQNKGTAGFSAPMVASMLSFEILYVHPAPAPAPAPTVRLGVKAKLRPSYSYDQNTIFPVIASLKPSSSSLAGTSNAEVKVLGAPLSAYEVNIGDMTVPVLRRNGDTRKLMFNIPPSDSPGSVSVSIKWAGALVSNSLTFTYVAGPAVDPIAFTEHVLVSDSNGKPIKNELTSSIRIGNDGKIYLGTLNARIIRLTYDEESLRVTENCQSKPLTEEQFKRNGTVAQRSILGMALDPRDGTPHPYVSTQTLFWLVRDRIDPDNMAAWRNGAIDRLKPGHDRNDQSICLVFDKKIISGLPVSNHDHGVNGLEFTQSGDLIIAIGGNTNAGLPGAGLGELFETPLSGAIILAKLSKGQTFDGRIRYSNDTHPRTSNVTSGDVDIIGTGIRNGFFPSLHSSGRLYISDNGPNAGFGHVASICGEVDAPIQYPSNTSSNFQGKVKLGPSWDMYSVQRPDKILHIKLDGEARFYGHPNPNRGECGYIDPFTNKGPSGERPSRNYVPPLLTVTSSTNAIVEYHAGNVFNGALQGKLILSTYKDRATYYIPPVTKPGEATPENLSPRGGLSLAVDAWGQMIIPRLEKNNILVLRPKVPNLEARKGVSITAVTPFRHGEAGGTIATIGGYNFGPGAASVSIGDGSCEVLTQSLTKITCRTPRASRPGRLERVVVKIEGGETAILRKGLWYMKV